MNEGDRPGFEGGLRLPFKGVWPKIGDDVFIAPTATSAETLVSFR